MGFRSVLVTKDESGQKARLADFDEADLMDGDVTVATEYSTINYKDGLAITGKGPIVRKFPLIPGIDFSGTVEKSAHGEFQRGDRVILTGWGVGESHHGGLAQKARVKGNWLVKLPAGLTARQAMAIGTAGYTAMLAVLALEHEEVTPASGDVLVTGASGGVGSIAIALLSRLGYRVLASTGRPSETDYLKSLGAAEIVDRNTLSQPAKPLGPERWAGAIDSVGSHTLATVLSQTRSYGAVAACGLAGGMDLPGSVAPFILRGVTLAGINSVYTPKPKRIEAWTRLARDLDLDKLEAMASVVALDQVFDVAERILTGQVRGRTVVDVNA